MEFTKFVSLLENSALFFSRADKLGDPFEGSHSRVNLAMHPILYKDLPAETRQQLPAIWKNFRRYIALNCWHWSDHESAAMWSLYGRDHDGIAIKTDFNSLAACFTDDIDVYVGQVEYVDYDVSFIPEGSIFPAYLHKRKSFEHEREIRALIMQLPPTDRSGLHAGSPDVWVDGRYCTISLTELVHEVIVSPLAPDWFSDLVKSVAAKYDLHTQVRRSNLAQVPSWS